MSCLKAILRGMSDAESSNPDYQIIRVATAPQYSAGAAYLLLLLTFVGVAGVQHFYLGHYVRGVVWLLTWGLLGIGTIYDLFALGAQTSAANYRRSTLVATPMSS